MEVNAPPTRDRARRPRSYGLGAEAASRARAASRAATAAAHAGARGAERAHPGAGGRQGRGDPPGRPRGDAEGDAAGRQALLPHGHHRQRQLAAPRFARRRRARADVDRKSTRLNSSHRCISYAVFCLKKKEMKSWWLRVETEVTVGDAAEGPVPNNTKKGGRRRVTIDAPSTLDRVKIQVAVLIYEFDR